MRVARATIFGSAAWIFLGGSILLMFFVVLSGVKHTTPLDKIYFLRADTSRISNARPITQWTYFYDCGDKNTNCSDAVPAIPFGYAWKGGGTGAPGALFGNFGKHTTAKYYYYMWRFGWVFYLMGLVSAVIGGLFGILFCIRFLAKFTAAWLYFALFWFTLATVLMTVTFVKARNVFHDAGISATIGKYAFGFTWAAWFSLLLAAMLFHIGGKRTDGVQRSSSRISRKRNSGSGGFGRFGRQPAADGVVDKEYA